MDNAPCHLGYVSPAVDYPGNQEFNCKIEYDANREFEKTSIYPGKSKKQVSRQAWRREYKPEVTLN